LKIALPLWLGIIILEIWKLSMLRDLHKSLPEMLLLGLRMHIYRDLSVRQQWRPQKPGKVLVHGRDDDVSR
jgi:hypothetical protein